MFSSPCEAQITKSPPIEQKDKRGETPEILVSSQDDERWSRAAILEAIAEFEFCHSQTHDQ